MASTAFFIFYYLYSNIFSNSSFERGKKILQDPAQHIQCETKLKQRMVFALEDFFKIILTIFSHCYL
jgi:hypothetical protein